MSEWQGPPVPVQQAGPAAPPRRRWGLWLVVGVVVVVGVGAFVLTRGDGGGGDGVVLLPAAEVGTDAFTGDLDEAPPGERGAEPIDPQSLEGVEELDGSFALAALSVVGSEPGVYGGERDEAACDVDALGEALEDGRMADAWFTAVDPDVGERQRDDYLDELTPVRLRLDTRVTSHRYTDGRATASQAILQAGTAVMVDQRGVPRVRCAGGNPLGEPEAANPSLEGDRALDVGALAENPGEAWDGFDPAAVAVVDTRHVVDDGFELASLNGDEAFVRPVGSDGSQDRGVFTPDRGDPDGCEENCHQLEITVETVAGTPAYVTFAGTRQPTSQTPTSLTWAPGAAAAGTYRYDVQHEWELYRTLEPGQPTDPTLYDDPAHDDETLVIDFPEPGTPGPQLPEVRECVPGDVTITVTVDGEVAERTTEHVSCTPSERSFVLE